MSKPGTWRPLINTRLNSFIHDTTAQDIPEPVLHMARRCFLDTMAVWIAGTSTDASKIARNHAARRYPGDLPLAFDGRGTNPVGFAFAGATTIDALDGHDGHQLCKGHASVALVPALFAEIGDADLSLNELLCHLIVGEEIAIRAGLSLHSTVPDYHSSGAWNALGCATIAARLRGFTADQTRQALGIAEYYGPRAQMMRCIDYPTMVKDSSSWGALAGVSAADLAEDGFTGSPALTVEAPEVAETWSDLGENWRILESNFKAYPVCRWAHPPVEAALALLRDNDFSVDDIKSITVTTFHEATRLTTRRPNGTDAAQYSLPLSVALALRFGTILPEFLLPAFFENDAIWGLVDKVDFEEADDLNAAFPAERYARVTLVLASGQRLESDTKAARGNHDAPLSDLELIEKFELYTNAMLPDTTRRMLKAILVDPASSPSTTELVGILRLTDTPGKAVGKL